MASKLGAGDEDGINEINITPFVDIILVVLIIFIVTTSTIIKQAIKVDLPEAATGETAIDTSLGLMLEKTGRLLLDGEPITENGLRNRLRDLRREHAASGGDIVCLIAADTEVQHGEVIHLIDVVKQEGVSRFALNIQPVARPPEAAGAVTDEPP